MKHKNFLKVRELTACKSLFIMLVMGILAIAAAVPAMAQMTSDRVVLGSKAPEGVGLQSVSPYVAPPEVFVPDSSKEVPEDVGVRMHTNYLIYNPSRIQPRALRDLSQPEPEENPEPNIAMKIVHETPASLACVYGMGRSYRGCAPMINKAYNATGGGRAIAIVIAYDNPTALTDLQYFSTYFRLPAPNFTKVLANGNGSCSTPPYDAGWALESALDTQWAHAMAPNAAIILVEACSSLTTDLMYAETVASTYLLSNYGGGEVSNSWSGSEWSGQTAYDDNFPAYGYSYGNNVLNTVSYFFSAGDNGYGAQYPSSSPWVISAGGTTINRDPKTKAFVSESCWAGSGGGISAYETSTVGFPSGTGWWAAYQYPIFGQASRMTPDMSFNADPASGVYVTYSGTWYIVGGTSLSAPALAGIVNNSNNQLGMATLFSVSGSGYFTNAENNLLYSQLLNHKEYVTNFYDVTTGSNGAPALPLWDYCTGVGSPRGKLGK